jgi:type II secretion system protein G
MQKTKKKGFTLLEILLVIAMIGILAVIVIVAINPIRQLSQARNAQRRVDINTIEKALEQYAIDNNGYPAGLTGTYQDICPSSGVCVDLSILIPNYIAGVPRDPSGANYQVAINPNNGKITVRAPGGELGQSIGNNIVVAGSRFTGFDTGATLGLDFPVNTIATQSDGKVIAGGQFTTYKGQNSLRIIRLNSDGTRDSGFNVGTGFAGGGNFVNAVAIQSDGKVIVGGGFTDYQGVSANRIIRLNSDGTRDAGFNIGSAFGSASPTNIVTEISIQPDGKIIVAGLFTDYQGVSANRIIRLNSDGTRDSGFNMGTGFSSWSVNSLAIQSDGKILVGGQFTSYQGVGANYIVRLNSDGTRDSGFNMGSGFNTTVDTMVIQSDGKIVVGGQFTSYQGVGANYIVRLNSDGTRDNSFNIGAGFSSGVNTVVLQSDGKIVVGGGFTTYQGGGANRIIRLNSNGGLDNSFNIGTGFNGYVGNLEIQSNGRILVGGGFTAYQDQSVRYLISLLP